MLTQGVLYFQIPHSSRQSLSNFGRISPLKWGHILCMSLGLLKVNPHNNVHMVKAVVFPVVMYGCECWTINRAEHQRTDAFVLWHWGRFLRVPWTTRKSNQSILMEISPEYSMEGLMLKLKFQYFGHLKGRTDSMEKTLMLRKIEGRRRRGC